MKTSELTGAALDWAVANRHPETGVRYAIYHINNDLHPDVWDDIYRGTSIDFAEFEADCRTRAARQIEDMLDMLEIELRPADYENVLDTIYEAMLEQLPFEPDEECYEGETDGIKWRTTWLGGAPHLFVFESPYYGVGRECSPCVPGAVDGGTIAAIFRDEAAAEAHRYHHDEGGPTRSCVGYCLPTTWLRNDFSTPDCPDCGCVQNGECLCSPSKPALGR